jgi:hypothetical protein
MEEIQGSPCLEACACVLLASGGCTGWNKLEFLTGRRVSPVFSTEEPSWQEGGHEFNACQLLYREQGLIEDCRVCGACVITG